jgi:hypothetical protein
MGSEIAHFQSRNMDQRTVTFGHHQVVTCAPQVGAASASVPGAGSVAKEPCVACGAVEMVYKMPEQCRSNFLYPVGVCARLALFKWLSKTAVFSKKRRDLRNRAF